MLFQVPNQRYKRSKIKNGQNDRSGNSSVNSVALFSVNLLLIRIGNEHSGVN